MGKAEAGSTKAIGNAIKAKGGLKLLVRVGSSVYVYADGQDTQEGGSLHIGDDRIDYDGEGRRGVEQAAEPCL